MSFLNTCADQLRSAISAATKLSPSNPERFHEQRSDLIVSLSQIADMLEGNFSIEPEEKPKAKRQVQKPHANVIKAASGNVVRVDFRKRKVTMSEKK